MKLVLLACTTGDERDKPLAVEVEIAGTEWPVLLGNERGVHPLLKKAGELLILQLRERHEAKK